MLEITKKLFNEWNKSKVIYCHWKSNEHLLEGLTGQTDLDILMSPDSKKKGEEILEKNGYVKFYPQYGSRYKMVDEWLGFDRKTGNMIHVHLHYRVITGNRGLKEYIFNWDEEILNTRVLDEKYDVYITNPNIELILLCARISLKMPIKKKIKIRLNKYNLSKDDKVELEWLRKRINCEKVKLYCEKFFKKNSNEIYNLIMKNKLTNSDLLKLNKLCRKELNKNREKNSFILWVSKYYYAFVLKIRYKIKNKFNTNQITKKVKDNKNGLLITFIGQDGSGKTTTSEIIYKWLNWKIECKKFYLGSGDNYFSWRKNLRNKIAKKKKNSFNKIINAYLLVSDYVHLAKNTYKTMIKAEKYSKKGGIAIFDRYPQIEYMGINDGPKLREKYLKKASNKLIKSIILHNAEIEEKYITKACKIAPDLVFKLMLSPEESIRRKPEENYEEVCIKHQIIKKLEFKNSRVVEIDATQEYEKELLEIKENIWAEIQK